MWSDNADQMSLFYSSSYSLKTDYTRYFLINKSFIRTGKRTMIGAVKDGMNSIIRYFNNNFCDGYFEDCIHLALNEVEIGKKSNSIIVKENRNTLVNEYWILIMNSLVFLDWF